MKVVRSWSKPNKKGLIGRKKVDWSIFEFGTTIPKEFYDDFAIVNCNQYLKVGDNVPIKLRIDNEIYEANLKYVKREDPTKGALQIRYDQNKELKELLKKRFTTSYYYLINNRAEKQKSPVVLDDENAEYMDFYQTEEPFVYNVELISRGTINVNNQPKFWWVNQGQSAEEEYEGRFLWAPKKTKQGISMPYHIDLLKAKKGDLVLAYSQGSINHICIIEEEAVSSNKPNSLSQHNWEEEGNLLKVKYYSLKQPIKRDEIPLEWRLKESGPFAKNGNVKQGYFFLLQDKFARSLIKKFTDRIPNEIKNIINNFEAYSIMQTSYISQKELIEHIHNFIKYKGFLYNREQIANLFLSLRTKPFVILSGISGTGKTKIVQLFAESLGATTESGQFTLIPVRPDWSDGSDLIGYEDLQGNFKAGPLTEVLMEANKPENRDKPYFVLLDEMNLARVEYYFSDLLSIIETKKLENNVLKSDPVINRDETGTLMLLDNVYIIGTVNMDETTHPFSKKVLDRANTIEYNEVNLDYFEFLQEDQTVDPIPISNKQLASQYIHLKDAYTGNEEIIHQVTNWLVEINSYLEKIQSHFAYRVRDEICFYMIYNEEARLMDREKAFDLQILQKILPRIIGNDLATDNVLKKLFEFCTNHTWGENLELDIIINEARFPKSAKKIANMIRKIETEGFTSFWM